MLLLQHEGNLQVDLVADYVAVLDQDVLVLYPRAFNAPKRLGSTGDGLIDSVLETRLGRSAQLCDSGNTHTYLCLLNPSLLVTSYMWPEDADAKHKGRDPA